MRCSQPHRKQQAHLEGKKGGTKKKTPCPSVVEVTEIRRGAAWRVNGKEALKAWGERGQPRPIPPACLSAQKP